MRVKSTPSRLPPPLSKKSPMSRYVYVICLVAAQELVAEGGARLARVGGRLDRPSTTVLPSGEGPVAKFGPPGDYCIMFHQESRRKVHLSAITHLKSIISTSIAAVAGTRTTGTGCLRG